MEEMLSSPLLVKMVIFLTSVSSPGINGVIIVITPIVFPLNKKYLAVSFPLPKTKAMKWHNEF